MKHFDARAPWIAGVVVLVAAAGGGLETISDPKLYSDHGWALYVFGADFMLLMIIILRAALQLRANKNFDARLEHAVKARLDLARQVGQLEGAARERNIRLDLQRRILDTLRDRSVILRDCDEDHELRLMRIEEKFRLSHDQAVARVALRGRAFDDSLDSTLVEELTRKQ
jgi:hypothetical protein